LGESLSNEIEVVDNEKRELIRRGVGPSLMKEEEEEEKGSKHEIEIVKHDERDFSSMEGMDDDEKGFVMVDLIDLIGLIAETLALAYMLRRKRVNVDSFYNRYMINDPSSLPKWFVEDQEKHYKPHIEIAEGLKKTVLIFSFI